MDKQYGTNLCKIVYFDEESVTDYIQIVAGGTLERTSELLDQTGDNGKVGVDGKIGLGISGIFKSLIGLDTSVSANSSLEASFSTERIARNIVKNTILSDFVDIIVHDGASQSSIKRFMGYKITAPKDSLSYVALISPYLSMLKGGASIPAGDFNIAIDRLDNTIKSAKGYYEFIGKKDDEQVIFRFNIKAFKNNYKVTDLTKMDLSVYAIKVGQSSIDQLVFNNELDIHTTTKDNPSYERQKKSSDPEDAATILDVYDVLLAGVEIEVKEND